MLRRLYSHVAEAIQLCCGGYTTMLQMLYSYVAEAIQPCCGGYTCFVTDNNTTPTKVVLSCLGLFVGLWQFLSMAPAYSFSG